MNEMPALIQRTMQRRGYRTQREIAEALGRDPSWVSRLLGGSLKTLPAPEDMEAIARATKLSVAELVQAAGYHVADDHPAANSDTAELIEHARMVDWQRDPSRLPVMHAILATWVEFDRNSLRAVAETEADYDGDAP